MRDSERRMARNRILDVLRSVRWRWRARIALRGLVWVVGLTGAVVFLSAMGLERLRYAPEAVVWLRVLTWGTFVVSFLWFLVRPLLVRVTDGQVALYLEEHEPSLEHSVVSALESGGTSASPELAHRVTEMAVERARSVDNGRRVEQSGLYRFAGALTVVSVLVLGAVLLGPTHLRHGLSALLLPTVDAEDVNPYSVAVQPGDVTIARGSDQMVSAALGGFEAGEASLFTRGEDDAAFSRLTMLPGIEGGFEVMLLAVGEPTQYFVEASGVRSPTFTIDVADLPYVDRIDLTYYFPRYTGLPARTIEDAGDVAALAGTVVELRIEPTMATPAGSLLLDGEAGVELEPQEDGTLTARFTVGQNRFYSIELARTTGEMVPASPEYTIDVLEDLDPSVSFTRPGRDMPASPIEEVYLEMSATDDYGIGDLRLVYSVNGGPEDTVPVFQTSGPPLPEVSTGHTIYLEEWELEPGDLVSYYALVRDNRSLGSDRVVASDIYFLNVRPFERAYRQAEQMGGGGGGGGMPPDDMALSELQRQVIAATFNLIRQRDSYTDEEFSENVVSVGLAQGRLQDQVAALLQRMQNRGLTQGDSGIRDVSTVLPLASEAMQRARDDLDAEELRDALPDEQEALRYLQQAEETYERFVSMQQQGGGGGGGGGQQAADDLADLFELELDKLKNQYETVQRGQQQQADNQVDELLEQLEELARRQEQEAERQRRRAMQSQGGAAGGNQSQRELAEQTEEAARQLQRLAREMNDRELEQTARDLQQAAESMRQAASQSGNAGATAEAGSALDRLEEARRRLEQARSERARRDAEDAIARVEELQRQQRDVQRQVRDLPTEQTPSRQQQIDDLRERKNQMNEAVTNLERQLDNAASAGRADNPQAARELQDAADHIRESKLKEKLQYSRGTIEQWDPQSATTLELAIESDLQALRDQLEQARGVSSERTENPLEDALDDTRDLVRGMEAMGRRLNEPQQGQQGQEGQQGQQGDQDQQGQSGQQGQQGQNDPQGESGQQGQQGQSGQEGQQGQQGQQGQSGQQGQQGQGGQQGGANDQAGGARGDGWVGDRRAGSWYGGAVRGEPRRLSPEEIRQYQRELAERADQVRELRDDLVEAGRSADDLSEVLEAMRRFEEDGLYTDPRALADLHEDVLNRLKRIEFGLRRDVEGEADRRATLTGSDEVPDGYRTLVEEYYRSLARSGNRSPGGN